MIKTPLTTYISKELKNEVQQVANKHQLSMSVIINLALQYFLLAERTGQPIKLDISMLNREFSFDTEEQFTKKLDE